MLIKSRIKTTINTTTASIPNTPARESSFLQALGLIFIRRKDMRWQKTAINARKITDYSQMLDTTCVQISMMITATIRKIDHQLACLDLTRPIAILF